MIRTAIFFSALLLLTTALFALSACTTPMVIPQHTLEGVTKVQESDVPVQVLCKDELPDKPSFVDKNRVMAMTPEAAARDVIAGLSQHYQYEMSLEEALAVCEGKTK